MEQEIVNKVAQSGIITLDAEDWVKEVSFDELDIKPFLFQGLLLREKEFRAQLKEFDFAVFENKVVAVYCSEPDAIIQHWAWMLLSTYFSQVNALAFSVEPTQLPQAFVMHKISTLNTADYQDARLVIKGCGKINLPPQYYLQITQKFTGIAKAIMFGEPCSTVPVYKRR
ncbi:MAG: DUF2480 family protein [Luteibaculaceae bacterium]